MGLREQQPFSLCTSSHLLTPKAVKAKVSKSRKRLPPAPTAPAECQD